MSYTELLEKYGALVQYGVDYMANFSPFADTFLAKFYQYKPEVDAQGYSIAWNNWRVDNSAEIIALYDALKAADLIPSAPTQ
jgi:hypothetical protein